MRGQALNLRGGDENAACRPDSRVRYAVASRESMRQAKVGKKIVIIAGPNGAGKTTFGSSSCYAKPDARIS